jgi:hypothetical protein
MEKKASSRVVAAIETVVVCIEITQKTPPQVRALIQQNKYFGVFILPCSDVFLTHAHPAKLMLALAAGHVVASLILLDSRRAGRALARVCQDPVGCF